MKFGTTLLAVGVSCLAVGCASTGDTNTRPAIPDEETSIGSETTQVGAAESYDPDEVVCKRTKKTGTRFKSKVCATRREWELYEERAQDITEELQRRGALGPPTTQ